MREKIERTLFWFKDKNEDLSYLDDDFFGLAILFNKLLNEKYEGKRIKFINIYFYTEEYYKMFPQLQRKYTHYYNGHLQYYGLFELAEFKQLDGRNQSEFIWFLACENLKEAAKSIKNNYLLESSKYAYKRGIELNLNPDYRAVEADVELYGQKMKASVWINFRNDGMYSKFTLEKGNQIIFEKPIDETKKGVEYFLEIYTGIETIDNSILIKGDREIDYLPLRINIDKSLLINS